MPATDPTLDVLALAAHPDDVELSMGGTVCKLVRQGYRVGVVDFTRGELGTRGTPEQRQAEAERASEILGLSVRENLGLPDGNIENTVENRRKVIRCIRRYRPHLVCTNAPEDRHPDHPAACALALAASFYAGLRKIETLDDGGMPQEPWRPSHIVHCLQSLTPEPTFVLDVTDVWDQRMRAMRAYESQVHAPGGEGAAGEEPATFISTPAFSEWLEARARSLGYRIGATYGEGFIYYQGPVGIDDLVATLGRRRNT